MRRSPFATLASIALSGAIAIGAVASCSRSAEPVPLRTFERARSLDVVCMHVRDDAGNLIMPPQPRPQTDCTAVPPNVSGDALPNHLFALVTQTLRGELAVVDLTSGHIVDVDQSTPGVNFVPVGELPADVASAPDGAISFVATAEPNKPALYALPSAPAAANSRDSHGIFGDEYSQAIPKITDWPVCALPQPPSALTLVPRGTASMAGADAGAGAGADGGAPTAAGAPGYDIAVVLPGAGRAPTKILVIDPAPFLRGAKLDTSAGPAIAPGSLAPCAYTKAIELTGDVPSEVPLGPEMTTGVPYVDGGIAVPVPQGATCNAPSPSPGDAGATDAGASDAATDGGVADAASGGADAGTLAIPKLPGDVPRAVTVARDGAVLYLADQGLPLIHVLDLSNAAEPRELAPLVATSIANPTRRVQVGALAVSPSTRDYKRFLYAVDVQDGGLMVFDVTDVARGNYSRVPMRRPHPEINPFQSVDRIQFSSAITGVTFVRHDWPITTDNGQQLTVAKTGLLCNPNVNANADPDRNLELPFRDPGALYRANQTAIEVALGPGRLRGVFGFVTLASGQMAVIDVDDWDAPCRRPDPMGVRPGPDGTEANGTQSALQPPVFSAEANGVRTQGVSDLAPLMPGPTSRDDLDPYHAPAAYYSTTGALTSGVTNEAFFPISMPHRPRSQYYLRRDPTTGIHVPYLPGLATLNSKGSALNTVGPNSVKNPMMLPTYSSLPDPGQITTPTDPNPRTRILTKEQAALDEAFLPVQSSIADVRFAWEDPLVHVDQDWTLTFEGALPGYDKLAAAFEPIAKGDYSAASLSVPNGLLCGRGVVDQRVASERAQQELEAFATGATFENESLLSAPRRIEHKLGDYVQILDDLAPQDDPYWSAAEPEGDRCWDDSLATPASRYDLCSRTFLGGGDEPTSRDFPILEAYDDHFVIGTYGYEDPQNPSTTSREVRPRDPVNAPFLKLARCCFHRQVHMRVRAGAEWVAVGSVSGFLHSMTRGEGGACVPSCQPQDALLNGRAPQVPRVKDLELPPALPPNATKAQVDARNTEVARVERRRAALRAYLERNSPLAFRNPMFSVVMWNALDAVGAAGNDVTPARDLQWAFQARGQFTPLTIPLAGRTVSVAPQVLRWIEPIRQMAVVDAQLQGLEMFDLRTLAPTRDPYL